MYNFVKPLFLSFVLVPVSVLAMQRKPVGPDEMNSFERKILLKPNTFWSEKELSRLQEMQNHPCSNFNSKGLMWALLYSSITPMKFTYTLPVTDEQKWFFARGVATWLNRQRYAPIPGWVPQEFHAAIQHHQFEDQVFFDTCALGPVDDIKPMVLNWSVDLHVASNKVRKKMNSMILEVRHDVCMTPLTVACSQNKPEMAEFLLTYGADINDLFIKDYNGDTVFDSVKEKNYTDVLALVEQHMLQKNEN